MTTREVLIREISQAPEEVLQETLNCLRSELHRRQEMKAEGSPRTTGPYSDYWNQFIGVAAGEEWERPKQGTAEQRLSW